MVTMEAYIAEVPAAANKVQVVLSMFNKANVDNVEGLKFLDPAALKAELEGANKENWTNDEKAQFTQVGLLRVAVFGPIQAVIAKFDLKFQIN